MCRSYHTWHYSADVHIWWRCFLQFDWVAISSLRNVSLFFFFYNIRMCHFCYFVTVFSHLFLICMRKRRIYVFVHVRLSGWPSVHLLHGNIRLCHFCYFVTVFSHLFLICMRKRRIYVFVHVRLSGWPSVHLLHGNSFTSGHCQQVL